MTILTAAPDGAQVIDLVAARAAQAEIDATLPPILLKLDVGYVELKREFDVLCAEDFTGGRFTTGLSKLLADPADIDAISAYGLTKDDLKQITAYISGKTLGE